MRPPTDPPTLGESKAATPTRGDATDGTATRLSFGTAAILTGIAMVCTGAAIVFRDVVVSASVLYPVALPDNPYFVPEHLLHLYVGVPAILTLTVLSTLAPAALLLLAFGRAAGVADFSARLVVGVFVVNVPVLALVRALVGDPNDAGTIRITMLSTVALAGAVLLLRAYSGRVVVSALRPVDRRRLAWFVAIPWVLTVLLLPVLLWQDFNPDGLEALSMGRSLTEHVIPRLPTGYASGLSLGMVTSAYPVDWFLTWFGPIEVSARAPLLLYVPLLFLVSIAVIELGMDRRMRMGEEIALSLAMLGFVVALGYNNAYHPYFADLASPANLDILVVTLMAATVYFAWAERGLLLCLAAVLASFNRPTGVLFLGLLALGTLVIDRRFDSRPLRLMAVALVVAVSTGALYERAIVPTLGLPLEDPGAQIGWRLRYFTFDDFSRFAFLLIPSGVLPALALFAWPVLDRRGRTLSLALLGYFAFFYVRGFVALHHFAPVMILPVLVLWRALLRQQPRRSWQGLAWALALIAIALSAPRSFEVNRTVREIGRSTAFDVGDYLGSWSQMREAFDAKDVLDSLFPPYWEIADPGEELIGSPWVQVHYASTVESSQSPQYWVRSPEATLSGGYTTIARSPEASLFVLDVERWEGDRRARETTDFASPLYAISRETLFPRLGIPAGNYSVDLRSVIGR